MSQTVVAVEIAFPQNDQGGYDVTGTPAGTGLIAFGNMTFDKNGHLLQNPSLKEINVRWSNGSNSTKIIMDWGPENGFDLNQKPSTHYGLTKLAGPNHEKFIEPDGNAPGSVIGYQYSKSGVITAVFSNGYTRDIYQVLIGAVSNYDGLDHKGGGLYVAMPSRSGQISLQIAGTAGVGSFISGALQGSAISASAEILDSTGIANLAKMLYHQVSTQKSIDDYALQRV
jgi:flagellar hook protein FlgE